MKTAATIISAALIAGVVVYLTFIRSSNSQGATRSQDRAGDSEPTTTAPQPDRATAGHQKPSGAPSLGEVVARGAEGVAEEEEEHAEIRRQMARANIPDEDSPEELAKAQAPIHAYFDASVKAKLRPCFSKLAEGSIMFGYRFVADEKHENWLAAPDDLELWDSKLPEHQDDIAIECMRKAIAGTSMPIEPGYEGDEFQIYWNWHTPAPPPSPAND